MTIHIGAYLYMVTAYKFYYKDKSKPDTNNNYIKNINLNIIYLLNK